MNKFDFLDITAHGYGRVASGLAEAEEHIRAGWVDGETG